MPDFTDFYQLENLDFTFGSIIVFLPRLISYREIFNPGSTLMEKNEKNKLQALIIDDETDICYLLKGILRNKNIEATYASTLAEGERFLKQSVATVIFLDNHLPDGFGIDHIGHFKKEYPQAKIVMISAHDTHSDRERAYKEGADFFIGKPFTRDSIIKTVEKII